MGGKRKARGQRGAHKTVASFAPGTPPSPTALDSVGRQPRQWAYPTGFNLAQRPRATETTTFEQLRNLAALYQRIGLSAPAFRHRGESLVAL